MALDGLLHPSPPTGARDQLAGLVESYAAKSDWAHLVFSLDAGESFRQLLQLRHFTNTDRMQMSA